MDTQMKKGVLELIVLMALVKQDRYGYELILEVSKVVNVNDGTIYPLLKRITNEKYADTYLVESKEGPPRKYYRLTVLGKQKLDELLATWNSFNDSVNNYIRECSYEQK